MVSNAWSLPIGRFRIWGRNLISALFPDQLGNSIIQNFPEAGSAQLLGLFTWHHGVICSLFCDKVAIGCYTPLGRYLPGYGAVVAIGVSGAGKSTLTSVLGGYEMGDEGIMLQWRERLMVAQACIGSGRALARVLGLAVPIAALLSPAHERSNVDRHDSWI